MQKSASPASVALRLNNLEQKFDEFEAPDPGGSDIELINRLAKMTVVGSATSVSGTTWKENDHFFEGAGNPSIATSLYGEYQYFPDVYHSVTDRPFYLQVFGNTHIAKFSSAGSKSISEAIFGTDTDSAEYFTDQSSLIELLFGSSNLGSEEIETKLEVLQSAGGLFNIIFGSAENAESLLGFEQSFYKFVFGRPEVVEFLLSDINKDFFRLIFGYSTDSIQDDFNRISGTNSRTDFLASVKKMRGDMDSLEQRIRYLEVHTGISLNG